MTAANLMTLADSVDYFLDKGVRTLYLNPRLTPDPDWRVERIDEMDRQLSRVYRSSRRLYERTGRVPLVLFRKGGAPSRVQEDHICGAGTGRNLTVDVDGQVTGCVLFAGSYRSTAWTRLLRGMDVLQIGRLGEPAFPARLAAYPDKARGSGLLVRPPGAHSSYGACSECRYHRRCDMCPAAIGSGADDPARIPDLLCAFTRLALKHSDRFPRQPPWFLTAPPRALRKILSSRGRGALGERGLALSAVRQRQPA
jgi:hypothetical protein